MHDAIREALANCLVNADYCGRQGDAIVKEKNKILLSIPGNFRIGVDTEKYGGISDPRNATILKIFNLTDIGEREGSGIPNIFFVWRKQGWKEPQIKQSAQPDRTSIILFIGQTIKNGDK